MTFEYPAPAQRSDAPDEHAARRTRGRFEMRATGEESDVGGVRRRTMARPRPVRQTGCRNVVGRLQFTKSMPAALGDSEDGEFLLQFARETCEESRRKTTRGAAAEDHDNSRAQARQYAFSMPATLEHEDGEGLFQSPREAYGECKPEETTTETEAAEEEEEIAREIHCDAKSIDLEAHSPPTERKCDGAHRSYQAVDEFEDQASARSVDSHDGGHPRRNSGRSSIPGHHRDGEEDAAPVRGECDDGDNEEDEEDDEEEVPGSIGTDCFGYDRRQSGWSLPSFSECEIDGTGDGVPPDRGDIDRNDDEEHDALAALCRQYAEMHRDEEVDFVPCRELTSNSVVRVLDHKCSDISEITCDQQATTAFQRRGTMRQSRIMDPISRSIGLDSVQETP